MNRRWWIILAVALAAYLGVMGCVMWLERFVTKLLPNRAVDPLRVASRGREQIDYQQIDSLAQQIRSLLGE